MGWNSRRTSSSSTSSHAAIPTPSTGLAGRRSRRHRPISWTSHHSPSSDALESRDGVPGTVAAQAVHRDVRGDVAPSRPATTLTRRPWRKAASVPPSHRPAVALCLHVPVVDRRPPARPLTVPASARHAVVARPPDLDARGGCAPRPPAIAPVVDRDRRPGRARRTRRRRRSAVPAPRARRADPPARCVGAPSSSTSTMSQGMSSSSSCATTSPRRRVGLRRPVRERHLDPRDRTDGRSSGRRTHVDRPPLRVAPQRGRDRSASCRSSVPSPAADSVTVDASGCIHQTLERR